ncbi:MAG: DUF1573 domain-containing protein [Planctomycetaceae bacterium]
MRALATVAGLALIGGAIALVLRIGGSGGVSGPVAANAEGKNTEGEYVNNPFTAASGGDVPKLESTETEFDFGIMKFPLVDGDDPDTEPDGDSHVFTISNVGKGVLKLAKGPSTCQCTMSEMQGDRLELQPGESTKVTITWKPEVTADPFEKGASIWTNDPALFASDSEWKDGRIMFKVKGRVLNAVDVDPGALFLGVLAETEPTKFESLVYSIARDDLDVSIEKTSSEFITAKVEPATPEQLKERSALSGAVIRGEIAPKLPVGAVREQVTLSTNDPNRPELAISIEAQRQGPVSIAGRYWNNAYTMVDFDKFEAAKGIETSLYLYTAKLEQPIELKIVEVRPEGLEVTAEQDSAYADENRDRFKITVKVPPGRPPERLLGKEAGLARFETNIPDVPSIKFHIVYESR